MGTPADSIWNREQELQYGEIIRWICWCNDGVPFAPGKLLFEMSRIERLLITRSASASLMWVDMVDGIHLRQGLEDQGNFFPPLKRIQLILTLFKDTIATTRVWHLYTLSSHEVDPTVSTFHQVEEVCFQRYVIWSLILLREDLSALLWQLHSVWQQQDTLFVSVWVFDFLRQDVIPGILYSFPPPFQPFQRVKKSRNQWKQRI